MTSLLAKTTFPLSFRAGRDFGSEAVHNAELGGTKEARKLGPRASSCIPATMVIEQVDVGVIRASGP